MRVGGGNGTIYSIRCALENVQVIQQRRDDEEAYTYVRLFGSPTAHLRFLSFQQQGKRSNGSFLMCFASPCDEWKKKANIRIHIYIYMEFSQITLSFLSMSFFISKLFFLYVYVCITVTYIYIYYIYIFF